MPCSVFGAPLANATATDKVQYAAFEKLHLDNLAQVQDALSKIQTPEIQRELLNELSIMNGPRLDVDNIVGPCEGNGSKFFLPCDFPFDVIEYLTREERWKWRNLDDVDPYGSSNMHNPEVKSDWLLASAIPLGEMVPRVWDFYVDPGEIMDQIGLDLPSRYFFSTSSGPAIRYEYAGRWVCIGPDDADIPHVSCLITDSGRPVDGTVLLSEAETAVALSVYQCENGRYTAHHTKPILITTLFRHQTARITQARFDGKRNKLVLHQSRILDLSGKEPGADAWTVLRWVACRPTGETRYGTSSTAVEESSGRNHAHMAPGILV